jgi:threonyl-tRNA synthetase
MRIREFIQDDAHVYCTKDQLLKEIETLIHIVHEIYRDFGFEHIIVRLATRPENRIGDDDVWDKAENVLEQALTAKQIDFELAPGEGAFYGPKIEFHLKDCLNRIWQCGTIQVDFSMPERLNAHYIAQDGSRQVPIMIHRAILGSIERFIGILMEHYSGWLPLWLAPVQVVVLNITDSQAKYADSIAKSLQKVGFRVKTDLRNEKISFKIREHTLAHVPYQLIIGDKEVEHQTMSVRHLTDKCSKEMSLSELIKALQTEIEEKKYR